MVHGDTIIEYKTLALPAVFFSWYFLQIFQNSAFEMKNTFEAHLFKQSSGFFTTYATCAEHGYFLVSSRIQMRLCEFGEFSK